MERLEEPQTRPTDAPVARAIGNLAGVVEWANDAFASLSGIPLAETVDKPVSRLLERAGIGLDVVELVAQEFFEGQVCRISFPFERPDGRRIEVVLDVTALRDEQGEVDRFLAEARELDDAGCGPGVAAASGAARTRPATPARRLRSADTTVRGSARSDLSAVVSGSIGHRSQAEVIGATDGRIALDFDLAPDLPPVAAPTDPLRRLLTSLVEAARLAVEAAANAGAVITVSTAVAQPFRRIVSKVHPIASGPPDPIDARQLALEVHDTGLPLPPDALERLRRIEVELCAGGGAGDEAGRDEFAAAAEAAAAVATGPRAAFGDGVGDGPAGPLAREALLRAALRTARTLGARLRFDGTPGCGNQVIVLLPCAPPPSGRPVGEGAPTGSAR